MSNVIKYQFNESPGALTSKNVRITTLHAAKPQQIMEFKQIGSEITFQHYNSTPAKCQNTNSVPGLPQRIKALIYQLVLTLLRLVIHILQKRYLGCGLAVCRNTFQMSGASTLHKTANILMFEF
ncbi:unnamed protein product [Ambrosiozyma monospora]|uniref:Unnamed protein product n=1 Tax=Ambrosiozyma monospora TaxID=43982 RepID=A0ACB5STY6_AMBMO|nr:unnamed protein product [Ambrosiozyma monospora]